MSYVGRFAPSPTGPLHIGSLVTALASYLDARSSGGRWLVRIEDIDAARESPGAAAHALRILEALALHWDGDVLYQSSRFAVYADAAGKLLEAGFAFRCSCTRAALRSSGNKGPLGYRYPGTCRSRTERRQATAVRVRVDSRRGDFVDRLQGLYSCDLAASVGDYMIIRRDALPAYHLAVVLDDAVQGVTDIVRGCDLFESTAIHVHLQQLLGLPTPRYAHLPIVTNARGEKLSKQTGALAADASSPSALGAELLRLLGAEIPTELRGAPPAELWRWAQTHWSIARLRGQRHLPHIEKN